MTEQEIDVRIAEYMGWQLVDNKNTYKNTNNNITLYTNIHMLPNYCNNLNDVWQVEEKLKVEGYQLIYMKMLEKIVYETVDEDDFDEYFSIRHATAKECCEAIIRTLEG